MSLPPETRIVMKYPFDVRPGGLRDVREAALPVGLER